NVWAAAERAAFLEAPIIHSRQPTESSSVNSKGKVFCVCEEYAEIDRWLSARNDTAHAHTLRFMAQTSQYNAYLWNLDRLAPEFKLEFLQRMRDEFRAYENAGALCWDDWPAWRALNLRSLMDDPEKYLDVRERSRDEGAASKALFALRLGGPKALVQAIAGRKKQ
ncbi:MAG: hypothetical protein Q4B69_04825, partial [Slackia sp.]|nr:hypothetical protein [Slackia sp.]